MQRTLRRHKDVRVFLEFHPYGLERAGFPGAKLLELIHSLGFQVQDVNERKMNVRLVTAAELLNVYTVQNKEFTNLYLARPPATAKRRK